MVGAKILLVKEDKDDKSVKSKKIPINSSDWNVISSNSCDRDNIGNSR